MATVGEQANLDTVVHEAVSAPTFRFGGQAPRSLRLRLSLLYGGLFLVSGAVLLAVTYTLVAHLPTASRVTQVAPGVLSVSPPPAAFHAIATSERAALLHGLLLRSGLVLALMAAVSLWLGWMVAGRVLRPLRTITATARQISDENLHQRLALSGPQDELRELADTIDELLARLEGAFEAQKSFVANASHELRTPLASMRVAIDVTTRKSPTASKDATSLAGRIREDLGQADRILESLLVLARAQGGAVTMREPVSLTRVAEHALAAHSRAAAARSISVHSTFDEVEVTGDETLLSRLAANLVDNAIRHNNDGGNVEVTVKAEGDTARLTVESDGPLLPENEIGEFVQPFRRLDNRTGSDEGAGLGLSIVAAITTAHQGTLELHGKPEGGLCVDVTLPRAADASPTGNHE